MERRRRSPPTCDKFDYLFIPHVMSCEEYTVLDLSVSPVFWSEQLFRNRVTEFCETCVVVEDTMCRCANLKENFDSTFWGELCPFELTNFYENLISYSNRLSEQLH